MSQSIVDNCCELLAPLGAVRSRRMFGGHGLYVDEVFIALIAVDRLYLKADALTRAQFEAAGCQPFEYTAADGGRTTLGYFSAPDAAMDSPHEMLPWARLALASALRARASKRPARARKTAASAARKASRG